MKNYKSLCIKLNLIVVLLFNFSNIEAQTEIFKSNLYITDDNLSNFYSSLSCDSTQIYINSNEYYVHAFDKKTGKLNWSCYLANKTNRPPIVFKNSIIIGKHVSEYNDKCIQLNSSSGDSIQTLKINQIFNQPIFKNDSMYGTAITAENGGCILAYDLNKNEVIWKQFVAHGVSTQPYFLKNKIVANAEDDNWFDIDYQGILKDTLCKKRTSIFVENIKCVKNFKLLSHDNKEIDAAFLTKNSVDNEAFDHKIHLNKTFILGSETLLILGNNKKILQKVNLNDIIVPLKTVSNDYKAILKTENNSIWFFINNKIIDYDFKIKKVNHEYDVSKWNVHQCILEDNILWLISRNDGQLYILNLI